MQSKVYFSSLLQINPKYRAAAGRLFNTLSACDVKYEFIQNTKDIWVRDFMPIKTNSGKYISFRYEPSYLKKHPKLRTDYKHDIAKQFPWPIIYSNINLDGGNVVFSPSKEKVIISDRVFSENNGLDVKELEHLLEARVIIIPSFDDDMTGHADGMVRFIDENTVLVNEGDGEVLREKGFDVVEFPYFDSAGMSAVGCYLNFLETAKHIFLPVFGVKSDDKVIEQTNQIFRKEIVPVNINEIAKDGGLLNCISWEM